jgi:hypothetical protein
VAAHRLLGIGDRQRGVGHAESNWLVGSGKCPPLGPFCSAPSTATALWSAWWDRLAAKLGVLARAQLDALQFFSDLHDGV